MGDSGAPGGSRATGVVGREAERARLDAFVSELHGGVRALVIRGEAGIGKTALWRVGVERCQHAGFHVLVTRPAEEEMRLPLVGLVDLLEDAEPLDPAALDPDAGPLVRGRAVLEALRRLEASAPVVVAIDDLQWLDAVSARALRHSLRKLEREAVGVLATARIEAGADDPLDLAGTMAPGRHDVLELGPLSVEDMRAVLGGIVTAVSPPLLRRIHEVSAGNPLYTIEIARTLARDEHVSGTPRALALPPSLQAAIADRVDSVSPELVPLLEMLSALGRTSIPELREILGGADVGALISDARRNGLVVVEHGRDVRFAHPLVRAAVYGRMSPLERRSLHGRLADRTTDPTSRARHLALSSDRPDEVVAQLLEEASDRAADRGALDLGAELAGHSLRLTPSRDVVAVRRRALGEVSKLAAAGEVGRALSLADQLVATMPPGPDRAEALVRRSQLEDDDLDTGEAFLVRALEEAADDVLLRGRVLDMLGWLRGVFRGDLAAGITCARVAVDLAGRAGDLELEMSAAAGLSNMEALAGNPRPELVERAVVLERTLGRPPLWAGPRVLHAEQLLWAGDLPRARALLEASHREALRSGNGRWLSYGLYDLASLECAAGDFAAADAFVHQAVDAARDSEDAHVEIWILHRRALVATWLGRVQEARDAAERRLAEAAKRGERPGIVRSRWILGLLALSAGEAETAASELTEAVRLLEEMGYANPGTIPALPDAVEALAHAGEVATARMLAARLERQAVTLGSAWVNAAVERSRGIVLLAEGDPDAAGPLLQRATESFDRLGHRPDAARALLAHGRALLRGGRRTDAASALSEAQSRFAEMGATLWEARAAAELERLDPDRGAGTLTATERRVAALVAEGKRNREIARALLVSVGTVEGHLTRIYRKLEIRSRSELARRVAGHRSRQAPGGP